MQAYEQITNLQVRHHGDGATRLQITDLKLVSIWLNNRIAWFNDSDCKLSEHCNVKYTKACGQNRNVVNRTHANHIRSDKKL